MQKQKTQGQTRTQTRTDRDLLRIATFILFDAVLFHEALAGGNPSATGVISLRKATQPLQTFLDKEWGKILRIDYAPVFSLAREVLLTFPSSPNTEAILKEVTDAAIGVVSSGVLLRQDFMGRVYHRLLLHTTGHFYATYYTSIPAASLLANLAIKTPNPNWDFKDLEGIARLRVIDPACGSGTLLSATYSAIKDQFVLARPANLDLVGLHRLLVEQVLSGWDVLDYAAHLTLTTLSMHSNLVRIDKSNIYTVPAGIDDTGVHLGSLDYLWSQQRLTGRGFSAIPVQQSLAERLPQDIAVGDYDLVIMNPPFSRSAKPNIKFGYSTEDTRAKMSDELRRLAAQNQISGIGQAGLGAYFMLLALKLVRPEGRIAVVIPRALLSGVSWRKVREHFEEACEIEYIVSNYDPGNAQEGIEPWNWSENTALGEVLIIARKTEMLPDERSCTFINLWHKPKNEVEGLITSHQITRARELPADISIEQWQPLTLQKKTIGSLYRVPQSSLARNWLAPCVFADPHLNALVLKCMDQKLPCIPLKQIAKKLGVDIKQVKDHFAPADRTTPYPMVWGHQGAMNTILLHSEHLGWGRPKRGKSSQQLYNVGAATVLIAERPHLSTEALLAMTTPSKVLTTAFWEVHLKDDRYVAPLLLWANSTYGILQFLACATSSMGDIFKMKKDQLQDMPIGDPSRLNVAKCEELLTQVGKKAFARYGEEFAGAARSSGVRLEIDQFLQQSLDLPPITQQHYELLAKDPVVVKRRV